MYSTVLQTKLLYYYGYWAAKQVPDEFRLSGTAMSVYLAYVQPRLPGQFHHYDALPRCPNEPVLSHRVSSSCYRVGRNLCRDELDFGFAIVRQWTGKSPRWTCKRRKGIFLTLMKRDKVIAIDKMDCVLISTSAGLIRHGFRPQIFVGRKNNFVTS